MCSVKKSGGSFTVPVLAISLALNVVGGFYLTAADSPAPLQDEPVACADAAMPSDVFDFYTKALDSCRESRSVVLDVYCGGLDAAACNTKFDRDIQAQGGELLERYQALKSATEKESS